MVNTEFRDDSSAIPEMHAESSPAARADARARGQRPREPDGKEKIGDEAIYRLWDQLSDFDAGASDEALDFFLARVCRWLEAENGFWIGAIRIQRGAKARRDALSGWRAGALHVLDREMIDEQQQRAGLRELNREGGEPGETSRQLTRQAGAFRIATLSSGTLVDLDAFKETEHYKRYYQDLKVCDRMWVVLPINPEAEAYYCFDKRGTRRRFTDADMALVARATRGIKWFHRRLHLSHGLGISERALAPAERRVLQAVLSGKTEKQISEQLGLSPGSVHQYIVALCRAFGTRGRAELMALWITHSL